MMCMDTKTQTKMAECAAYIKTTDFYREKCSGLYLLGGDMERIYFKAKADYTPEDMDKVDMQLHENGYAFFVSDAAMLDGVKNLIPV